MQKSTVGEVIKEVRTKRKMTLKNLSDKTKLSISFLSQLERGKTSATLHSLKKISLALEVNPGYFFEDKSNRQVTSVSERLSDHQFYYKDLSGDIVQPAFSPLLITLKPGQNEGDLLVHDGQEFLYVLQGTLTVKVNEEVSTLNPNDSIMFNSMQPHYWYNYTNEDVQFLCISYDEK